MFYGATGINQRARGLFEDKIFKYY